MSKKLLQVILTLHIGIISMIGDKIIENSNNIVLRGVIDNLTHGLVAGISWTVILLLGQNSIIQNIPNIVICSLISSLIDIDHFIEARSWKLNEAINLERRPFLHCTTLPILFWLLLLQISKIYESTKWENFNWLLFISFLSHHVRDSTRRGFWLAPFGTTKAIPYYSYIITDMILPHAVYLLMNLWTNKLTVQRDITSNV